MKEQLITLIQNSVGGCARNWAEVIADSIIADGWTKPVYTIGGKLYIHQFDNALNKIVVECEIIQVNEADELLRIETEDGRVLNLTFRFVGKTVFLTREEAERALKGENKNA